MNKSQNVASAGILTAVGILLLYFASLSPAAQLGLCASAGVVPSLAVNRNGIKTGILIYIATALLAVFVVPNKPIAFLYAGFFGLYAVVKYFIEQIKKMPVEWILKLIFFNFAAVVIFLFGNELLKLFPAKIISSALFFLIVGNVVFIAYDVAFSKLISFFCVRFSKK